jgi:hypothetical protein
MYFFVVRFLAAIFVCFAVANAAPAIISGLEVDFPIELKKTFDSQERKDTPLSPSVAASVTHHGKNAEGSMEITVSRITYVDAAKPSIERDSKAQLIRMARMPGVTNPAQAMSDAKVSGKEAKRLSFKCERMGKKVGIEALYIIRGQHFYVVQLVFLQNDAVRTEAENMLAKVKLAAE